MSFLRGRGRVDGDVAGGRPVALLEHERVEAGLGGVDREADVRRAAELDHVAVVVDQLRLSADAAHSGVDFWQRRTSASRDSSNEGISTPESSLTSKAVSPVMTASVPW